LVLAAWCWKETQGENPQHLHEDQIQSTEVLQANPMVKLRIFAMNAMLLSVFWLSMRTANIADVAANLYFPTWNQLQSNLVH
jgi:hypothetical protein